jgi:ferritin-like metal-binding protein YciE
MEDAAELLEETLDEEKAADEKLSELAFGVSMKRRKAKTTKRKKETRKSRSARRHARNSGDG